jgi:hypothetical protein
MHGIANRVARDKDVTIQLRHRLIRNYESVAVLMKYQPPGEGIALLGWGTWACQEWPFASL